VIEGRETYEKRSMKIETVPAPRPDVIEKRSNVQQQEERRIETSPSGSIETRSKVEQEEHRHIQQGPPATVIEKRTTVEVPVAPRTRERTVEEYETED
jgi:hypothetical protein